MIRAVQTAVEQAEVPLVDAVYMATKPSPTARPGCRIRFSGKRQRTDLVWFDNRYRVRGVWLDGELRHLA